MVNMYSGFLNVTPKVLSILLKSSQVFHDLREHYWMIFLVTKVFFTQNVLAAFNICIKAKS